MRHLPLDARKIGKWRCPSRSARIIEAVLFRADKPIEEADLMGFVAEDEQLLDILHNLQNHYAKRGIHLVRRDTAWSFITATDISDALVLESDVPRTLSRAAMETLAIIAYYQPITRLEIEEIRGVGLARTTLDQLLDAGWVTPAGHRAIPGRPTLWATTPDFLHHFNLESLHDLPMRAELEQDGLISGEVQGELFSYSSERNP